MNLEKELKNSAVANDLLFVCKTECYNCGLEEKFSVMNAFKSKLNFVHCPYCEQDTASVAYIYSAIKKAICLEELGGDSCDSSLIRGIVDSRIKGDNDSMLRYVDELIEKNKEFY